MSNHVFRHKHPLEVLAIVHFKRMPDEIRNDRARPAPGLHRTLRPLRVELIDLPQKILRDKRPFFRAATHIFLPSCYLLLASGISTSFIVAYLRLMTDSPYRTVIRRR